MARAIDAEYVEKIFEKWLDNIPDGEETPAIEACLNVVRNAPTLTPPNEWVSVEERLPEESYGMVLLTNGKVVISGYRNKLFGLDGKHGVFAPAIKRGGGYMQVTYWMPLPAPPDRCPPEGIQ